MRRRSLSEGERPEGGGAKNCSGIYNGHRNDELSVDCSVPGVSDAWQYRAVGIRVPLLPIAHPTVVAGSDEEIFERNEPHERLADWAKRCAEHAWPDPLESVGRGVRYTLRAQPQLGSGVLQKRSQHPETVPPTIRATPTTSQPWLASM